MNSRRFGKRHFGKKIAETSRIFFAETSLPKRPVPERTEVEPFDRIAGIEWNAVEFNRICCMALVASLPSPSSNIEAWPNGTSLRFASLLHSGHSSIRVFSISVDHCPPQCHEHGPSILACWQPFPWRCRTSQRSSWIGSCWGA